MEPSNPIVSNQTSSASKPAAYEDLPVILVFGETGVGKSNFISVAGPNLSVKPIIGHGLHSCTKSVTEFIVQNPSNPEQYARLVDTPGFDDTDSMGNDYDQMSLILDWLEERPNQKLAGILFLFDIRQAKAMIRIAVVNPRMIPRPPGVTLVTGKWSTPDAAEEAERETELQDMFWLSPEDMKRFDNTADGAWKIISNMLDKPSEMTLGTLRGRMSSMVQPLHASQKKRVGGLGYTRMMRFIRGLFS